MESLGETRKRRTSSENDEVTPPKSKRRSGTETIQFLMETKEFNREKHDAEMKLRSEDLEIRKKEVDTNSNFMANICQTIAATQQQSQQQLQQQWQMQQQQMQQQNLLFAALIEKLNK